MFRILRSLWIWAASLALVLLWVPLMAAVRLCDRDPRHLRTARWFRRLGRVLAKINPWRIHISSVETFDPGRVYVIVSNHQSFADIPVISHLMIDTKWLGKAELFRTPVLGWMLRMAGDVRVDRSDRRSSARALLQCARYLREGCSVVFFPEGTRSPDGHVLPFNDGPFQLAIREGVPVLPLVVQGSGAALPRNSWLFGPAQDIHLRVLKPVSTGGLTVQDTRELQTRVRDMIIGELARLRGAPIVSGPK
jgi:1-acyl-sn-glycerol-3-phosphate acyltransferase